MSADAISRDGRPDRFADLAIGSGARLMKPQCAPRRLSAQLRSGCSAAPRRHRDDGFAVEYRLAVHACIAMEMHDAALGNQLDHFDDDLHDVADLYRAME